MAQVQAITSSNANSLSTSALNVYNTLVSPLVLDLTGVDSWTTQNVASLPSAAFNVLTSTNLSTGLQTLNIDQSGVQFDLANSGDSKANVGWITPGEGFLVNVPLGATNISNGSELFGTATLIPNGQTAANGFAALSVFDTNNDGIINNSDPIFNQLMVWVDTGSNSGSPVGELLTLNQLNIESLNLNAKVSDQVNNGNVIGLVSSYTTKNGQTHELADVWLSSTDPNGSTINQLTNALNQYAGQNLTGNTTSNSSNLNNTSGNDSTKADKTLLLSLALNQYGDNKNSAAPAVPVLGMNQNSNINDPLNLTLGINSSSK